MWPIVEPGGRQRFAHVYKSGMFLAPSSDEEFPICQLCSVTIWHAGRPLSPCSFRVSSYRSRPKYAGRGGLHDHRNAHLQDKPGKRAESLEIFRVKSIPAHKEIGMKIP